MCSLQKQRTAIDSATQPEYKQWILRIEVTSPPRGKAMRRVAAVSVIAFAVCVLSVGVATSEPVHLQVTYCTSEAYDRPVFRGRNEICWQSCVTEACYDRGLEVSNTTSCDEVDEDSCMYM